MDEGKIIDIIIGGRHNEQWLNEISALPSIEVYKANLDNLWNKDKTAMTIEEIRQLYFANAILFPNVSRIIESEIFNNLSLWRARSNIQPSENLFVSDTYSYPRECKYNGRANIKSQPVFYCSLTAMGALFEVKPEAGQTVYLSLWKPRTNRAIHAQFLLPEKLPEKNIFFNFQNRQKLEIASASRKFGIDKAQHLETLVHFIRSAYVEEAFPYPLTSWISHNMLFGKDSVDLLLYPSVASALNLCNIATRPEIVDDYMQIKTIYKVFVKAVQPPNITLIVEEIAEHIQNKIVWRELCEEDELNLPWKNNNS